MSFAARFRKVARLGPDCVAVPRLVRGVAIAAALVHATPAWASAPPATASREPVPYAAPSGDPPREPSRDSARSRDSAKRSELRWDERWPRVRPVEYVITAIFGAIAIGVNVGVDGRARFTARNSFDDAARAGLRLETPEGRAAARTVADAFYYTLAVYPAAVDSGLLAKVVHGNDDVAWQTFMIYAQSILANGAITTTSQGMVGRVRPLVEHCDDPVQRDPTTCGSRQEHRSFFAGHVSTSFTGAGITCVNHAHLPLLGSKWARAVACGVPLAAAASVAYLRVAADKHWASDVLVGAAVGTTFGVGLPLALHYGASESPGGQPRTVGRQAASLYALPMSSPTVTGVALAGAF